MDQSNAQDNYAGATATSLIVKQLGVGDYAAYWCDTLTTGGFTNWYLPTLGELWNSINRDVSIGRLNPAIKAAGGAEMKFTYYLTSLEINASRVYQADLHMGDIFT